MSSLINWDITLRHRRSPQGEPYVYLKIQVFAPNKIEALAGTTERIEGLGMNPMDWEYLEVHVLLTPFDLENGKLRPIPV